MRYAKLVHEVDSRSNFMSDNSCPILGNDKFPVMKISEKIASLENLHHYLNVVLILEHVEKPDYARMLTDFEHFNLTFKQF